MGKHWYTDGQSQVLTEECPEGFKPGRLPVSEETRRKHSENNAWKSMSEEQKKARAKKISNTINNRTEEEKKEYSKKLSEARKGKGVGKEPWNKGLKGAQEAWNKGTPIKEEVRQKLKDKYKNLSEDEKERRRKAISEAHKGKTPWNKGLKIKLDPETIKQAKYKEIRTKKLKGNFQSSALEEYFYKRLLDIFNQEDIIRQYFNEELYPFACDFYIKPLDIYVEINGNWTHGYTPYDQKDQYCIKQLAKWEEKAKTSEYYKMAIYVWTDLDVRKRRTAEENNLNLFMLYSKDEIEVFLEALREG